MGNGIHAVVNEGLQFAREASFNAGGAANLVDPNLVINWDQVLPTKETGNGAWTSNVIPQSESSTGDATCDTGFVNILLPLLSIVRKVDPVAGSGGASGSQVWTFLAPDRGLFDIQSWVFEKGDGAPGVAEGLNYRYAGAYWNSFSLSSTLTECVHTGTLLAGIEDQIPAMSALASPSYELENVLVDPKDIDLFYSLTSMVDLESAPQQIHNNFDYTFGLDGRYNPYQHQKSTQDQPEGNVPVKPDASITLTQSAQTNVGRTDFNEPFTKVLQRKGQSLWLRWQAIGSQIAAGPPVVRYLIQIDAKVQVRGPYGKPDVNGVRGKTADLRIVRDGVSGYPFKIKVVNKTAATLLVPA